MSSVPPLALDALSRDDLKKLVIQLLTRLAVLEDENRRLRDENARLKALPKRPQLAPGGMDKATEPDKSATRQARRRRKRQSGPRTPPATEERTLVVEVPPGSRRRGFETDTVQDLVLSAQVIRFQRERWVTPDGQEVVAPLPPEVTGHFGPGVVRYVLMQHVQGQVTVERLRCSGARRPENGVLPWFLDHQAARTASGRPKSSIRLRTVTAIRVSTSWVSRVCERKVSPMMRLYRLIAPSAPALAL
jgi:hypothetical protein